MVRADRRSGGVSIFIRDLFETTMLPNFSYVSENIEVCTVEVKINTEKIFIIGIYRPHHGTIQDFTDEMERILRNPIFRNRRCLIAGDFNIRMEQQNPDINRFTDCMYSYHMYPVITKPTRFPSDDLSQPSTIDLIWTNALNMNKSGIVMHDATDHCPTFICVPTINNKSIDLGEFIDISFRLENDINKEKFTDMINSYDWLSLASDNVNEYVDRFVEKLNRMYCRAFPLKSKRVSKRKMMNPWFTREVGELIRNKSTYFDMLRIGAISKQENNMYKNKVKTAIDRAKSKYYKKLFDKNMGNLRATWKTLNSLMHRSSNPSTVKSLVQNSIVFFDDENISKIFSDFFAKVSVHLDSNFHLIIWTLITMFHQILVNLLN